MNTTTPPRFAQLLNKILGPAEIIALGGTIVGFALSNLEMLNIFMSVLAGVYFLTGYVPREADNVVISIAARMSWIACSVTIIGSLFRVLQLNGSSGMLMIGCTALVITIIEWAFFALTKPDASKLVPILYRAVPVCLFGLYFFTTTPA